MSYRDDLTAAQARADAVMQSLVLEREAREVDTAHIAGLERTLAESLRELGELRERSTQAPSPQTDPAHHSSATQSSQQPIAGTIFFFVALASVPLLVLVLLVGGDEEPNEYAQESELGWRLTESDRDIMMSADLGMDFLSPELQTIMELGQPKAGLATAQVFDVTEGIGRASAMAADYFGEDVLDPPYLVGLHATAVDDEGKSHLKYGEVKYSFSVRRPSLPPSPKSDAPIGTRPPKHVDSRSCRIEVTVDSDGMTIPRDPRAMLNALPSNSIGDRKSVNAMMMKEEGSCKRLPLATRCSVATIRQRAVKRGASAGALARVSIGSTLKRECRDFICTAKPKHGCCVDKSKRWDVQIVDRGDTLFDARIPDKCKRKDVESPQSK